MSGKQIEEFFIPMIKRLAMGMAHTHTHITMVTIGNVKIVVESNTIHSI